MKAELKIPDGYERARKVGWVRKEDYALDPESMTWVQLDYMVKVSDCFFVIRKVEK